MSRLGNITGVDREAGYITRRTLLALDRRLKEIENTLATVIRNDAVIVSHADLNDLSYAGSGHTGFASSASLSSHTGDSTIHFTEASIDHGSITGLGDDDHTIYLLADGSRNVGSLNSTGGTTTWSFTSFREDGGITPTTAIQLGGDGSATRGIVDFALAGVKARVYTNGAIYSAQDFWAGVTTWTADPPTGGTKLAYIPKEVTSLSGSGTVGRFEIVRSGAGNVSQLYIWLTDSNDAVVPIYLGETQ